jgi:hypothetical protein
VSGTLNGLKALAKCFYHDNIDLIVVFQEIEHLDLVPLLQTPRQFDIRRDFTSWSITLQPIRLSCLIAATPFIRKPIKVIDGETDIECPVSILAVCQIEPPFLGHTNDGPSRILSGFAINPSEHSRMDTIEGKDDDCADECDNTKCAY